MKYLIEINEVGSKFEVVYFEGERKQIQFNSMDEALIFVSGCDLSQLYENNN